MSKGQGSRDSHSTVHNFTACCGYYASEDGVKAVPSVVWDAWDSWIVEKVPGTGMDTKIPVFLPFSKEYMGSSVSCGADGGMHLGREGMWACSYASGE
jgi:hypothetical protein